MSRLYIQRTPDSEAGLRPGDNVEVRLAGTKTVKYYRITNRDTIFYLDKHSTLAAGGTESYAEVTDLDPPTGQLYQIYNIWISGNVKVYLKQPAATNRWGTNKAPEAGLLTDRISPIKNGMLVNLWIMEDYPPNVQIKNDTNVSITPVLYWIGWRYSLEEISKPDVYTQIVVGGLSE